MDSRRGSHADEHDPEHEHDAPSKRARRYWQLADSDDALPPHDALSTAVLRAVTQRSDERIEGLTFDLHGP
jgi:hypothetical protein